MTLAKVPGNEQRETERAALHVLEHHYAWIATKNGEVKTRIIDFSPFGLGVVLEGSVTRIAINQGDRVQIQLHRDGQDVRVEAMLVTLGKTTILRQPYTRLGFKIVTRDEAESKETGNARTQQARNKRFELGGVAPLVCQCDDPTRAGQKAFFTVRDISSKGVFLETSARNKFLLPGLRLHMSIGIPGSGEFWEELSVRHVHPSRERYLLGCEFAGLSPRTLAALADFCLNFGKDVSYQIMLDEGFPIKLEKGALNVATTSSFQDFIQITRLRLASEGAGGAGLKAETGEVGSWSMIDAIDDEAQHVCVKLGKRVVASARMLFDQGSVSVSRIALDKDFSGAHGSYIFYRLWSEIFRLAFKSEMKRMLIEHPSTWPEKFYALGLKKIPSRAVSLSAPGLDVSSLDLRALKEGQRTHFLLWAYLIAPLIPLCSGEYELTISRKLSFKLALARLLRPWVLRRFRRDESWRNLELKDGASV